LLAGEKEAIQVIVKRDRYQGPVEVLLVGLPQGLTCDPVTIPAGQNAATLELKTHPNTQPLKDRLNGVGRVGNYELFSWRLFATVHRPPTGMRLVPIPSIALKVGANHTVKVTVDRRGYRGPIEVRLDPLPTGVTCKPGVSTGGEGLVTLELAADQRTVEGQYQLELILVVGGASYDRQKVVLKIEKKLPGTPPPGNLGR
jgi:hypothetical protein